MKIIDSKSLSISVIAAGKGWLAANKPAGVTVHNAPGRDICSLVSAFIQREPAASGQMDMDPDFGVNPVHRLDKETSGIILLAVTPAAFRFFSEQFESRQVKKQYVAILHGRLETPQLNDPWGTWRRKLAKTAGGRLSPEGAGQRQNAETRYRVLECSAHYTMVEIEPLTGRRHQIRRHAKLAGHPVVGDSRYGSRRAASYLSRNFAFHRLALHAHALTLRLPGDTVPQTLKTPAIPDQMRELFDNDRGYNKSP
ncbi:MAG: RNA pseudouridine synthase [Desulfobacterales bacterium]|nr:RNA pseudouridine synthase [Desulfobacterales bacterium]